jgi:polyisoprenoid-binding protein YceI
MRLSAGIPLADDAEILHGSACQRFRVSNNDRNMTHNLRTSLRIFLLVSLSAAITSAASGPLRVGQAEVSVKCPMTVGGSFDARTSALTGTLTASAARSSFEGSLAVDLRTVDTGIDLRNDHLREKYLEVDKGAGYDQAILSEVALQGVNADAAGKGSFTGSLMLHGVKRTVSGPVDIRQAGTGWRVRASFPVNLPDYNIDKPRYLGVGVKDTVQVSVTFTVTQS